MQGLGSLATIFAEKRQLFTFFKDNDVGVVYGDQPLLDQASYAHPVVRFGLKKKNQIQASNVTAHADGISFDLRLYKEHKTVFLRTTHRGYVSNALAAGSVAHLLGLPLEVIAKGLESFTPCQGRFERRRLRSGGGWLINDCYNANPESMRAALVALDEMEAGPKIAILGDMLELGDKELFWHRQIGHVLHDTATIDQIILVGERARSIAKTAPLKLQVDYACNWKEATEMLEKKVSRCPGATVLVKASNAMGLENLVARVCE